MKAYMYKMLLSSVVILGMTACPTPNQNDGGVVDAGDLADANDVDAGDDVDVDTDAGQQGAACVFNRECADNERCECSEEDGCFCVVGARGTGVNGVDTCTSGNECSSSLCVEGPSEENGVFYCSDECNDDVDCPTTLPICSDIAFIGKICVRAG